MKPHEAVPLSEFGGRAEKEEVAPEVVQSWRRKTLDTDISQIVPTSDSSSNRTEIRPLARSTPVPTTPPNSKQQQPQLSTIQQEDSREEGTVEPSESHPERVNACNMGRSYPPPWAQKPLDSYERRLIKTHPG